VVNRSSSKQRYSVHSDRDRASPRGVREDARQRAWRRVRSRATQPLVLQHDDEGGNVVSLPRRTSSHPAISRSTCDAGWTSRSNISKETHPGPPPASRSSAPSSNSSSQREIITRSLNPSSSVRDRNEIECIPCLTSGRRVDDEGHYEFELQALDRAQLGRPVDGQDCSG
jgi:hypothetical protein